LHEHLIERVNLIADQSGWAESCNNQDGRCWKS
jgi:hypothetical protein